MRCFVALRQWELQTPDLAGRMCGEGFGIRSGCLRVLAYIGMPKLNCSSGSSDACLAARVAPEECLLLSPHYFMVEMCGGYVCTLSCVRLRFIIRFIVALPVEP